MSLSPNKQNAVKNNIPIWTELLLKNSVPPYIVKIILAQLVFESGWFLSRAYLLNKNPAGITWNSNYLKRSGTSIGIKRKEGGNYVNFDNYETALKDYLRIINKNGSSGKPIEALSADDYVNRLKANNYFTADINEYKRGVNSILNNINTVLDLNAVIEKKKYNEASLSPLLLILVGSVLAYFIKK
jgi:flagellum-specific peptidoglycan hydrolase FlgJ